MKNCFSKQLIAMVAMLLIACLQTKAQTCSGGITIASGTTVTWDNTNQPPGYTINQSICIEDDATLNITNLTVNMDGYLYIFVHKGGTLNLNNAGLQPLVPGNTWFGIIVYGDNNEPLCDEVNETLNTDHHGLITAESSAIQNSQYGIKLTGYGDNQSGGGIIKINNTKFINQSDYGIYMGSYEIAGSNCYVNSVTNSEFITNNINTAPDAFIYMLSYRGLTVLGCRFENTSFSKLRTTGIKVLERNGVSEVAGILILDASEYVNPYDYQNSARFTTPKRNKFTNLKQGISIIGRFDITPSESIIKNCDFLRVQKGLYLEKVQNIDIICNTYKAEIYDATASIGDFGMKFNENQEDGMGGYTTVTTQNFPVPYSIFAHTYFTYGQINFYNNTCEWDADFINKDAIGIYLNQHNDPSTPLPYGLSNNTFTYTGVEGCKVTGIFIHGVFTAVETQLINNQFTQLYRDLHLKGQTQRAGVGSCFYPVLPPQGERVDYSTPPTPTVFSVGNGNVFSNPPVDGQGNIYADSDDKFYIHQPNGISPDYDPNFRTSCPLVYTSSTPFNEAPPVIDCVPFQAHVLLSDDNLEALQASQCFKVYPNPSQNMVYIDWAENSRRYNFTGAKIVIYNTMLQKVYTKTISDFETSVTISNTQLVPGLYFVTLQKEGKTICTNKLIKQ